MKNQTVVLIKLIKELIHGGMKEEKALGLVSSTYNVEIKILQILLHNGENHD